MQNAKLCSHALSCGLVQLAGTIHSGLHLTPPMVRIACDARIAKSETCMSVAVQRLVLNNPGLSHAMPWCPCTPLFIKNSPHQPEIKQTALGLQVWSRWHDPPHRPETSSPLCWFGSPLPKVSTPCLPWRVCLPVITDTTASGTPRRGGRSCCCCVCDRFLVSTALRTDYWARSRFRHRALPSLLLVCKISGAKSIMPQCNVAWRRMHSPLLLLVIAW
jgi:hypothetical protein